MQFVRGARARKLIDECGSVEGALRAGPSYASTDSPWTARSLSEMGRGSGRPRFTGAARKAPTRRERHARYSQIRRHRSAGLSARLVRLVDSSVRRLSFSPSSSRPYLLLCPMLYPALLSLSSLSSLSSRSFLLSFLYDSDYSTLDLSDIA